MSELRMALMKVDQKDDGMVGMTVVHLAALMVVQMAELMESA